MYVHSAGNTTVLRDISPSATVHDVCALWASRFEGTVDTRGIKVRTVKGRLLVGSQLVSRALGSTLELCLTVVQHQFRERVSHITEVATGDQAAIQDLHPCAQEQPDTPGTEHLQDAPQSRASSSPLTRPLLERAAEKEASQHYKTAAFIYEQVRASPREQPHADHDALLKIELLLPLLVSQGCMKSKPRHSTSGDSRSTCRYWRLMRGTRKPFYAMSGSCKGQSSMRRPSNTLREQ